MYKNLESIPKEIYPEICELYQNGNTLDFIARKFDTHSYLISRVLKMSGVKTRQVKLSENKYIRINLKRKNINKLFEYSQKNNLSVEEIIENFIESL